MRDLKWFPKWNRDNPTNVYGPAVAFGVVGAAILIAALVIVWGYPFARVAQQTGPRGAGMEVVKSAAAVAAPDPTAEAYYTEARYEPQSGDALARDVYQNVQVLGDVTEDNFNRLMLAITQWVAPDQGCVFCHGEEGDFAADDHYTKVVARRMLQMTRHINDEWDAHVGATGVNCYTCHRGQNVPSNIWFRITPVLEVAQGWGAVQNIVTPQSSWTSLPSDALEKYLLENESIKVHDLEPRVPNEGTAAIQNAERTYSLMNYFANSLGVNCTFCHNTRAFFDPGQVTPQWATATLGISMVQELNNDYLVPLADTLPPNRLGDKHADAPKLACKTCHKGESKPMRGLSMTEDWPELVGGRPPS